LYLEVDEPSIMPTDAKRQAVTELVELLRNSSALAVADYRGLSVSNMQSVRRTLRASNVELHVAKNRLLKIAADEADLSELKPMLEGPTALASISGDEIAMAKALQDAFRPYARTVTIRGGLLGHRAVDASTAAAPGDPAEPRRAARPPGRRNGGPHRGDGRRPRRESAKPCRRALRNRRSEANQ